MTSRYTSDLNMTRLSIITKEKKMTEDEIFPRTRVAEQQQTR